MGKFSAHALENSRELLRGHGRPSPQSLKDLAKLNFRESCDLGRAEALTRLLREPLGSAGFLP